MIRGVLCVVVVWCGVSGVSSDVWRMVCGVPCVACGVWCGVCDVACALLWQCVLCGVAWCVACGLGGVRFVISVLA